MAPAEGRVGMRVVPEAAWDKCSPLVGDRGEPHRVEHREVWLRGSVALLGRSRAERWGWTRWAAPELRNAALGVGGGPAGGELKERIQEMNHKKNARELSLFRNGPCLLALNVLTNLIFTTTSRLRDYY